MKKLLTLLTFLSLAFLANAQSNIFSPPWCITSAPPTFHPGPKGCRVAIDTNTQRLYIWKVGTTWVDMGDRIQHVIGCSAPLYVPNKWQSNVVYNDCNPRQLFVYQGAGVWDEIGADSPVITDATLAGDGSLSTPLKIAQQAATLNQVLKWNGTTWAPAADDGGTYTAGSGISIVGPVISNTGDLSATNELITGFGVNSGSLVVSDAGGNFNVPLTNIAPLQDITPGAGISISGAANKTITNTSPSLWTDGGAATYLTSTSDNLAIGTTTATHKLTIFGTPATGGVSSNMGYNVTLIAAPPNSFTATVSSGGSMTVGLHYFRITYYNAVGETSASNFVSATTTAGNQTVTLNSIPTSSDASVIGRRVYMSNVGQSSTDGALVATIADNTTTTYTHTASDGVPGGFIYAKANTTSNFFSVDGVRTFVPDASYLSVGRNGNNTLTGPLNILIGHNVAPLLAKGGFNFLAGFQAGSRLTDGNDNISIAGDASEVFSSATTASRNISMLRFALKSCVTCTDDIALGYNALATTTGEGSIGIGRSALQFQPGSASIGIGSFAGASITATNYVDDIFIGYNAGFNASQLASAKNTIVIGNGAYSTASNQTILGNTNTTTTGIGTYSPTSKLEITTNALGVTQSDAAGVTISTTTPAADGAQQISPAIRWRGQGWKTTATAASQTVDFRAFVTPVQGTTSPTGYLGFGSSINGAAYSDNQIMFSTLGQVGVGIIPTAYKLDVVGECRFFNSSGYGVSINSDGRMFVSTTGGSVGLNIIDANNGIFDFTGGAQTWRQVSLNGGNFEIRDQNTSGLTRIAIMKTSGNVGINTNTPDRQFHVESSDAVTNAVTYQQRITHITSGTAAIGFGGGTEFELENASGTNRVAATEEVTWTDAVDATEDAQWKLRMVRNGTLTDAFSITSDGVARFTGYNTFSQRYGFWDGSSGNYGYIKGESNGIFTLLNVAESDFNRIGFGGTTSSYPSLKRSGTGLVSRLADDSADAPFTASNLISTATVRLKGYTVATLPTGVAGDIAYVTDALAPAYGVTVVGGGSVVTPVFFDGTNWTAR